MLLTASCAKYEEIDQLASRASYGLTLGGEMLGQLRCMRQDVSFAMVFGTL